MRRTQLPLLVPVAAALGLAGLPAAASASTYCVGSQPVGTSCTTQYPLSAAGLTSAVNAANGSGSADDVRVGAGTISAIPVTALTGGGDRLVGAGRAATTLKFSATSGSLLAIGSGGAATAQDLSIEGSGFSSNGTVLQVGAGSLAQHITIRERTANTAFAVTTVTVSPGATLHDAAVDLDSAQDVGIALNNGAAIVDDTSIVGPGAAGVQISSSGTQTLRRLRISGPGYGVTSDYGSFNLDDSLIDLGSRANAIGVNGRNFNNGNSPITPALRRVTIVGSGSNQTGVYANADSPGETVTTSIRDSLLRLTGTNAQDVHCGDAGLTGTSSLTMLNVGYGALSVHAPTCPLTNTASVDLAAHPPKFVDAATGDYRPTWNSPIVDKGTGTTPGATGDLAGAARLVDGDGNGAALVDLGAYEYQRKAPSAPASAVIPGAATAGASIQFSAAGASDADADPVGYAWDFGDGTAATGANAAHTYAAAGIYSVSVVATDPTGRQSTPLSGTVTVTSPANDSPTPSATPTSTPTPTPGAAPTPTPSPAGTPTATLVAAPKGKLARGGAGFAIAPRATTRTATLALQHATQMRFTVTRLSQGRLRGKACTTKRATGKPCTIRTTIKGTATLPVAADRVALSFGGTFAGKRLAAGAYEVTVAPLDAASQPGKSITYRVTFR